MTEPKNDDVVREAVRDRYAEIARTGSPCCCGPTCCDPSSAAGDTTVSLARKAGHDESLKVGYTEEDLATAPEAANLGLGCGNPQAIAELKAGEVVVDLGAGAGFDCFLAARAVGPAGLVIGVDMTSEMVAKAREIAREAGYENVHFRLGEIEHLPVADQTADVVISNCVINLSPDKPAVYGEAFRVLKPGGRLAVSDVVATGGLPPEWRDDMRLLSACISGASTVSETEEMLREAGFVEISIRPKDQSREFIREWEPGRRLEDFVLSASICAKKPCRGSDVLAEETRCL
ncbi:MAG: arsenite methyltransferase [Actinomycetia bacterium]|nr:arsenite methyltransferase [Actinomycetes bacterium]